MPLFSESFIALVCLVWMTLLATLSAVVWLLDRRQKARARRRCSTAEYRLNEAVLARKYAEDDLAAARRRHARMAAGVRR